MITSTAGIQERPTVDVMFVVEVVAGEVFYVGRNWVSALRRDLK